MIQQQKRLSSLLQLTLVILLFVDPLSLPNPVRAEGAGDNVDEIDKGSEDEEEPEAHYDDDFLRKYTLDVDPDNDCRDITDTFLNCTEQKEKGLCDPGHAENAMLQVPTVCPVTCGTCRKPPTQTAIWVDSVCYDYGEDIRVSFSNTDPEPDDFIAIYAAYLDIIHELENTAQTEMWLYACGNVEETCRSASGGLIFGSRGVNPSLAWYFFPLEPGTYKAALLRHNGTLLAESTQFTAKPEDHSCAFECRDSVFADSECYEHDDMIHLTFEDCAARNDDRIAIYAAKGGEDPAAKEQQDDDEPLLWLDACSSGDCMGDFKTDFVSFGSAEARQLLQGKEAWPLPQGEYYAALVRIGEGGSHGRKVVKSEVFEVVAEGDVCYKDEEDL